MTRRWSNASEFIGKEDSEHSESLLSGLFLSLFDHRSERVQPGSQTLQFYMQKHRRELPVLLPERLYSARGWEELQRWGDFGFIHHLPLVPVNSRETSWKTCFPGLSAPVDSGSLGMGVKLGSGGCWRLVAAAILARYPVSITDDVHEGLDGTNSPRLWWGCFPVDSFPVCFAYSLSVQQWCSLGGLYAVILEVCLIN